MQRKKMPKHVGVRDRDMDVLVFMWDAPHSIEAMLAAGLFPSYGCAARRIQKLRDLGWIRIAFTRKSGKGRPVQYFEVIRSSVQYWIEHEVCQTKEWAETLVRAKKLPADWLLRIEK